MTTTRTGSCLLLLLVCFHASLRAAAAEIERRLPPQGIELPAEVRERLSQRLDVLKQQLPALRDDPRAADAEVFLKAVDYALRHGEFYNEKEIPRADEALDIAAERIEDLLAGTVPWHRQSGLVVRGYRSSIDDSVQPYGLVIPDDVDFDKPVPLYVWLHGRGDKTTDLHFIHQRLSKAGQIQPAGAIVLHPLGRQCIGYKSAGEVDVFEAIRDVMQNYRVDSRRIVLMGFSMGGAGAWHVGAHHAHSFVAISPGAGFAETARYNKLEPAAYPPWFEQRLWGLYDVPNYTRNLFNSPVVVYSGENDKQIQAARVMEEAYLAHGRELPHIIGPGMGHKYHPESLKEVLARMDAAVKKGLNRKPKKVTLQTQTLRYNQMFWVQARGLAEHWRDSRVDAEIMADGTIRVSTKNITALRLTPKKNMAGAVIEIDGETVRVPKTKRPAVVADLKRGSTWQLADPRTYRDGLKKRIGLQGPIDDAFMEPFLVVLPSGRASSEPVQAWLEFEQQHFVDRWRALMRGELRVKRDVDVTDEDLRKYNIVAWGTPETNHFLNILASPTSGSPIRWTRDELRVGERTFDAAHHVPAFIYPRGNKYLVVNSGLTFREGHDRTNSLQNPKLPDWAVLDIRQPPNDLTPGKVVAADFFDEAWQLKPRNIDPESR